MTKYINKQDYWKLADAQEFSFYGELVEEVTKGEIKVKSHPTFYYYDKYDNYIGNSYEMEFDELLEEAGFEIEEGYYD